ncbi:MAG: alpha/beta hydrolase [Spirulina sp. SIO3F2]|nr:alpha/beta hydrolase [Spirulina sp. SIO3F2]
MSTVLFRFGQLWQGSMLTAGLAIGMLSASSAIAADWVSPSANRQYSVRDLEHFAQTGETNTAITEILFIKPEYTAEDMRKGLNRVIDVDLDNIKDKSISDLDQKDQDDLYGIYPDLTDDQYRTALRRIGETGNETSVISFVRAFPVETITTADFFDIVTSPFKKFIDKPSISFWIEGENRGDLGLFPVLENVTIIDFEQGVPEIDNLTYSSDNSFDLKTLVERDTSKSRSTGGADNQYLSVFYSPLNSSKREIKIEFKKTLDYFGMHWGTVDAYNSIHFMKDEKLIDSFTGRDIVDGFTNNIYVNFLSSDPESYFNKIILSSTSPDFETDNHAYRSVPEPTMLLGSLAFGVFYGVAKRKRK